ncbi:MAG: site-2 protease family protein [Bryobacteraceae bacterium]
MYGLAGATKPRRYWVHVLLLGLTLLTTSMMGARLAYNFRSNRPAFDLERDLAGLNDLWADPWRIVDGLPFSLTLLTILLAHELGHYLACAYYRVDATLPYFLPAPTFVGTLGAFIRIRSPIYSKRMLFDIGIAGPLAGFVVLTPALAIGLAYSKVIPGIAHRGDLVFGAPPLLWLLQSLIFPGVPSSDIYLHPIARAAWVGLFATALNLLPIGQLDGGHILYSFAGDRHRLLSRLFLLALLPIGYFYWEGWLVWAVLLLLFGMRHPSIYDPSPMDDVRRRLAWMALAVFLLSFTVAPVRPGLAS